MIFFDFDGTVADIWLRYHRVFLTASAFSSISLSDYRDAKQTLVSDQAVAQRFGAELPEAYSQRKRALLEELEFLRLDTLLVSPKELTSFFSKNDSRFLTKRRRAEAFFEELETLGLGELVKQSVVLDPDRKISKKLFLERNFPHGSHIIVGDSKEEWEAAKLKNVYTVLVRTGLRKPEDFPLMERCTVMPSIREFMKIYSERGT